MEHQYDNNFPNNHVSTHETSSIVIVTSLGNSVALTIRDLLVHEGYFIHVVLSMERVISEILKYKPEMLILVNESPIAQGVSLIKEIKQNPDLEDMIIVILSSTLTTEAMVHMLNNGVDDIVNPYQPRVALAHIQAIFRRLRKR